MFQTPGSTAPPPAMPGASAPTTGPAPEGEFTRLMRAPAATPGAGYNPPGGAFAPPPPPVAGGTGIFAAPGAGMQQMPAGQSEFTQFISARQAAPAPPAAPQPAPPPAAEFKPKTNYLPLIVILGILLVLGVAVVLIVVLSPK